MEKTFLRRSLTWLAFASGVAILAGCAAVDANLSHGTLAVNTHLSETVFLDPVPPEKRSIYVTVRNTSDHPELDIKAALVAAMGQRGYLVVQDPGKAQFMLRANVLQAGEVDAKNKGALMSAAYGEPLLGGALAAGATAAAGGNSAATTGVGLGVAAATFLANQAWQQKTYTVVTDIELSARPLSGAKVSQNTASLAANGNSSAKFQTSGIPTGSGLQAGMASSTYTANARAVTQSINEDSDFKKYQIRAIAYADQVNLKFENALSGLEGKLVSALSNLFEEGPLPSAAQVDAAFAPTTASSGRSAPKKP